MLKKLAFISVLFLMGGICKAYAEPQYLIFWGYPPDPVEVQIQKLMDRLGTKGDGKLHILGFGANIPVFTNHEEQIPVAIHEAFALAKRFNMAVFFTIDDHIFWDQRPDLWNWFDPAKEGYNPDNKVNVEWSDWEKTANKAKYLNWGAPQKLAPAMCLTSRKVREEISRIVRQRIAPALKAEIEALRKEGNEHLFAGSLVGAEPGIDDYTQADPETQQLMKLNKDPIVRLGYCALTAKGFSQANPPQNFTKSLAEVNQEFSSFWARQLVEAGIPGSKLYTHVPAAVPQDTHNAPIWVAFNQYSRPGWTTYPADTIVSFDPLYKELQKHGNPAWGGVEANANFGSWRLGWENYLARHYNHGAVLVGINVGATRQSLTNLLEKSAFGPDALAAYKKFLSGETLHDDDSPAKNLAKTIQEKMRKVRNGIEDWQRQDRDPSAIGRMMEDLEPLLRQGEYEKAEALLNQALEELGKTQ